MKLVPQNSLLLSELRGLDLSQWGDHICATDDQGLMPPDFEPNEVVWLTEEKDPEQSLRTIQERRLFHLVQKNALDHISEVATAARMIDRPEEFFKSPLDVILRSASGETLQKRVGHKMLTSSADKDDALKALLDFVKSTDGAVSVSEAVRTVADEMITNAVFNAPFVSAQDPGAQQSVSRRIRVQLNPKERAVIFWAATQTRFVVGCADPFGAIHLHEILKRLQLSYQKGVSDSIRPGHAGAGIGFRLVFEMSHSFYLGVFRGRRTIVASVFPLKKAARKWKLDHKNIHLLDTNPPT